MIEYVDIQEITFTLGFSSGTKEIYRTLLEDYIWKKETGQLIRG